MASLFMIVAALLEFAIVLILKHHPSKAGGQTPNEAEKGEPTNTTFANIFRVRTADEPTRQREAWTAEQTPKKPSHERIDQACFRIFPITFALFNVMYAAVYYQI